MYYNPDKHHRRSIRLRGYDYAQAGAYFVTICTQHRALLFEDSTARRLAERCWLEIPDHFPIVELDEWIVMPNHIHGIIVLGNDVRGVSSDSDDERRRGVQLNARTMEGDDSSADSGDDQRRVVQLNARTTEGDDDRRMIADRDPTNPFSIISPRRNTLAVIVRTYKAAVTTLCRRAACNGFMWQRNYYEHIIRSENELNRIRQYIIENPIYWAQDANNPGCGTRMT